MKPKQILSMVPVVALVLFFLLAAGCAREGGASDLGMMEQSPRGGYGYVFADVRAMLDNEYVQDWYDQYGDFLEEVETNLGVSLDQLTALATNGEVVLVKGNFVLDDIADSLEDQGYQDDKYKDVEIWESSGEGDSDAVALIDDTLIAVGSVDNVEDCIDTIKGDASSQADDRDLRDMMDRLPSGVAVGCAEVPGEIRIALGYYGFSSLGDVDVAGASIRFPDSESLLLTVILKFDTQSDAEDAKDNIKDDIEDAIERYLANYLDFNDLEEIDVSQDGEYVTVKVQLSMDILENLVELFLQSR